MRCARMNAHIKVGKCVHFWRKIKKRGEHLPNVGEEKKDGYLEKKDS